MDRDNPALKCFCINGPNACPHPKELPCAYYHIEFGLRMCRELQSDAARAKTQENK